VSAHLISTDLAPIGSFYLVFMGVLAAGLRLQPRAPARGAAAAPDGRPPGWLERRLPVGWRALAAHVIATAAGGYLLLMAVLTGYYYGISKVGNHFQESAFTGCAMLAGLALPVFGVASWLAWHRHGRSAASAGPPPAGPPPAGSPPAGSPPAGPAPPGQPVAG
jgi:hypothetical protein